jgi:ribosome modulation factor
MYGQRVATARTHGVWWAMTRGHGGARQRAELDHAKAHGFESYFAGLTPADVPHDEYSGLIRDWWLSGWRQAREIDQRSAAADESF